MKMMMGLIVAFALTTAVHGEKSKAAQDQGRALQAVRFTGTTSASESAEIDCRLRALVPRCEDDNALRQFGAPALGLWH
ncbi:unnamed protein product [Vitrella brassicaformis CCMP3155]|uniref:Uncharacterized protein n=1 Tax=Vitrella brassicaformis (strain CCMP3155) TaxID=1169540 RepID=A0A0G4EGB8_VITBC|nr:unnamed protein product [Vitrella brassicaformis CCMP3155]|eukprot:CEL94439.1 unnamed protein product [Vitrella brassicaformis CCMP3155]